MESRIRRSCSSLSAAYRPRFMPVEGLVSQISPRPSFTRRHSRGRVPAGTAFGPIKETREPALSRRTYIVLTKKSPSDRETRRDKTRRKSRSGQEGRREDATHYDSCLRCGKNPSDTHRALRASNRPSTCGGSRVIRRGKGGLFYKAEALS